MKCVKCLKDKATGECYEIKDTTARNDIEALKTRVNRNENNIRDADSGYKNFRNQVGYVGSIHITTSELSPATIYGGTWEKIEDRFLIGSGANRPINSTGGAKTSVVGYRNLPNDVLSVVYNATSNPITVNATDWGYPTIPSKGYACATNENRYLFEGTNPAGQIGIDIIPPYYTVHIWRRIA